MSKITRIAYNSSGWQRPTGDAREGEAAGTYNSDNGFGHEDWLFRSEWQIDGWRYAFLQGVNKSREKLIREAKAFDVTLYTIETDKRRRYVADILGLECLDSRQAADAVQAFKEHGWYDAMRWEVKAVGGNEAMLRNSPRAGDILNVRFRVDEVVPFPPGTYVDVDDPVTRIPRYVLSDKTTIFRERADKVDARRKAATKRICSRPTCGRPLLPCCAHRSIGACRRCCWSCCVRKLRERESFAKKTSSTSRWKPMTT